MIAKISKYMQNDIFLIVKNKLKCYPAYRAALRFTEPFGTNFVVTYVYYP